MNKEDRVSRRRSSGHQSGDQVVPHLQVSQTKSNKKAGLLIYGLPSDFDRQLHLTISVIVARSVYQSTMNRVAESNRKVLSHSSESRKSEIEALAGPGSL